MTLEQYLEQTISRLFAKRTEDNVAKTIKEAMEELHRLGISPEEQKWFWSELEKRIPQERAMIILKESQAAAALNDLVAHALATIQQVNAGGIRK